MYIYNIRYIRYIYIYIYICMYIITINIPSTRTGRAFFFFLTHSFFTERDSRGHGRHLHDSLLWCRGLFLCFDHLGGTSDAFRDLLGDWMVRPWWTWLEIVVIHCRFFLAIVIVNIIYTLICLFEPGLAAFWKRQGLLWRAVLQSIWMIEKLPGKA